ncbi:MAG: sugar kinase [Candidatus Limnocylindrales bacterium]
MRTGPEVVTLGECLVSLVAGEVGPLAEATTFHPHVAGAEANVAVGLVRLGHTVAYIGRVGDDGFGTAILRRLRGEGVDTRCVRVEPEGGTGIMFRERRAVGPSEVVYRRAASAGSRLGAEDIEAGVEAGLFVGARHLHLTGITPALSENCRGAVDASIEAARSAGMTVSLDLNLRRRLWTDDQARPVLAALVPRADIVFASLEEAAVVAGGTGVGGDPTERAAATARRLLDLGTGRVVLKLDAGASGSYAADGSSVIVPAVPDVPLIDPVGAGDAFGAGYLAGMLEGLDEATALALGNACGASVMGAEGDLAGAPSRAEADRIRRFSAGQSIR